MPLFLFREIWWSTSESSCDEEGSRSHPCSQEGTSKRDQEAGTNFEGSKNAGQVAVEEQNAKQKRWKISKEEIKKESSLFLVSFLLELFLKKIKYFLLERLALFNQIIYYRQWHLPSPFLLTFKKTRMDCFEFFFNCFTKSNKLKWESDIKLAGSRCLLSSILDVDRFNVGHPKMLYECLFDATQTIHIPTHFCMF